MLVGFLTAISVFLGCWSLRMYRIGTLHKKALHRQIRQQFGPVIEEVSVPSEGSWILRMAERFDRSQPGVKLAGGLKLLYLPLRPSEYIAYNLLAVVVLTGLLCAVFALSFWMAFVLANIGIELAKRILAKKRRHKNTELMNRQLPEVCRLLANALRAGLAVAQAIELAAGEAPMPARSELRRLHREMQLGAEFESVMRKFQKRMRSPHIELFSGIVINQKRIGGNLVQALEQLARTFEDRLLLQEAIRTMTAESKYIAYMLPAVPAVLLLMMNALIEGFVQPLFTAPGLVLLLLFIVVQTAAFYAVRKISSFKV